MQNRSLSVGEKNSESKKSSRVLGGFVPWFVWGSCGLYATY